MRATASTARAIFTCNSFLWRPSAPSAILRIKGKLKILRGTRGRSIAIGALGEFRVQLVGAAAVVAAYAGNQPGQAGGIGGAIAQSRV